MRVEITIDHTPTDATGVVLGVWDDDLSNGVYILMTTRMDTPISHPAVRTQYQ